MKSIEVTTSHNIIVRFELASIMQRILACVIDLCILGLFTFFVSLIGNEIIFWLLIFPVWAFYHLALEIFNQGQSIGKKMMKIRVVSVKGQTAKVNDYLIRWVFRLIEILPSMGTIAIIFASSSDKNQRIGDLLAQTSVVRQRNENIVSLENIKNIDREEEILYPMVTEYTDEDMLLLKQSLQRYQEKPTQSNLDIIDDLFARISDKLKVNRKAVNKMEFLKRVLYEYILQTR